MRARGSGRGNGLVSITTAFLFKLLLKLLVTLLQPLYFAECMRKSANSICAVITALTSSSLAVEARVIIIALDSVHATVVTR